jgi:hypothetical protein
MREKVMLNLIVQTTKPEVGQRCDLTFLAVRTCCQSRSSVLSPLV